MTSPLPRLERVGRGVRLVVDDEPFLALGGELHNSSSSDAAHLVDTWRDLRDSGMTSVIATVGWDQIEPVEGEYDLTVVDDLLAGARSAGVRLTLIWFGGFKNASSTYAPRWVRSDTARFPRADLGLNPYPVPFSYPGFMPRPVLSVFCDELRAADRRAYEAVVRHLDEVDERHTVILMQVENETGLLGTSRDVSAPALAAWNAPVPEALLEAVAAHPETFPVAFVDRVASSSGVSWAERFGDGADVVDEVFMAWGFGSYVGDLAAAGKAIKALPAYANAWLGPQPGQDAPGQYPSGGPTARMLGVWRAAAPAIDFLAPDIYVPNARLVMEEYAVHGNPLFVPEARIKAGDVLLAVGTHGAIGYHAFGLDDLRPGSQFADACRHLAALAPEIVAAQAEGRILGFALEPDEDAVSTVFGDTVVTVRNAPKLMRGMLLDVGVVLPEPPERESETRAGAAHGIQPADSRSFGIVVALAEDEYLVVGQGAIVDFDRGTVPIEVDAVRELRLTPEGWVDGRVLNGDERLSILAADRISAARIRLLEPR